MNFSFIMGAFTGWLAFTEEGKKFGNNLTAKCMRYIRENYLKEVNTNGNQGTIRKDANSDTRAE